MGWEARPLRVCACASLEIVEQCGLFKIPCKTSVSLQGVLSVLLLNQVWAIDSFPVQVFIPNSHLNISEISQM